MSTLHALTVPKWGMSMEEGEISQWRVAVGDKLAVGDEVVDIETSKITNAAESPVAPVPPPTVEPASTPDPSL